MTPSGPEGGRNLRPVEIVQEIQQGIAEPNPRFITAEQLTQDTYSLVDELPYWIMERIPQSVRMDALMSVRMDPMLKASTQRHLAGYLTLAVKKRPQLSDEAKKTYGALKAEQRRELKYQALEEQGIARPSRAEPMTAAQKAAASKLRREQKKGRTSFERMELAERAPDLLRAYGHNPAEYLRKAQALKAQPAYEGLSLQEIWKKMRGEGTSLADKLKGTAFTGGFDDDDEDDDEDDD